MRRHVEAEKRYHARRQRNQRRGNGASDDEHEHGFDDSPARDRRHRGSFSGSEGDAPPDRGRGGRGRQVDEFDSPRGGGGGLQKREAKSGRDGGGGSGGRGVGNGRDSVQLTGGLEASRALAKLISAMEGGRRDSSTR